MYTSKKFANQFLIYRNFVQVANLSAFGNDLVPRDFEFGYGINHSKYGTQQSNEQ
jgi:hypothetical protein